MTFRPKKIRAVAIPAAVAVAVLFTVLSFGLQGNAGFQDARMSFQRGDQIAMIGLGVLLGLGILAFCRPRVDADEAGVHIRNVVGGYDLPWSVVRAVRFDRNSAWAHLELHDDEQVAIHALQAVDKDYAVDGVRTLRALHSAAHDA
ncbi:PH domain-containing protein [Actinoplanes sp. NPDC051861]|uniref:PH domain-containing protein n=1 Tax=Actinoplanes sp. NPDC051861 TaxID=3155170 RepID=UPI003426C3C3